MTTTLFKGIKKWNLKRSNIISLHTCGKKASIFYVWESPIYTIYCPFSINDWSIYKGGRRYTLIFFLNFIMVFLCLKPFNNHSTHVQQMIMKPQVFISIQNGLIFFPLPLNSDLTRVLIPRTKGARLPFYAPPTNLGFFLKAVSSSYKSDFRTYLSLPRCPVISWSKRNYSKE